MKAVDRVLNFVKLNRDEDVKENEYLDEEEAYEEEQPGRRFIRTWRRDEDDEDDDETEEADYDYEDQRSSSSRRSSASTQSFSSRHERVSRMPGKEKISPIRSGDALREDGSLAVCVIRPHSMEDAAEITDTLLSGCAVILNAEGIELELAQRIIDFASGSCYAMNGNLQKISNYIFIITPSNVEISGDFQDLISGAFDVPFNHRY